MLEKSPQILVIPIDNRPVCYDLLKGTLDVFSGVKLFLPDKELLGDLNNSAKIMEIYDWLSSTIQNNDIDIAIIALDTLAYGGLVQSRKTSANYNEIKSYVDRFVDIINSSEKKIKIYATSSIMRISNNNFNEEEKSYWGTYGVDLYRYSYLAHKLLKNYNLELEAELINLSKKIPFEVIEDYLDTRKRNFEINSYYIDLLRRGFFEYLAFSQDDTAEYGLNVEEKELLNRQSIKEIVSDKVIIKTGADEMILALMSRALCEFFQETPGVCPIFPNERSKKIVSMYEDICIEDSVKSTVKLCGAEITLFQSALHLIINTPNKFQNDLSLGICQDLNSNIDADFLVEYINKTRNKYVIADIKNANGADNYFVEKILELGYLDENFFGFAAWNTTGNTLGTAISIAIIKDLALKYNAYNSDAFKKLLAVRFLDDWGYQSNVRQKIRENGELDTLSQEMQPFEDKIFNYLEIDEKANYSYPWDRTFEIKIDI